MELNEEVPIIWNRAKRRLMKSEVSRILNKLDHPSVDEVK